MHNGAIMSSDVRHLVDHARPYPLVRLSGVIDAAGADGVRDLLLDVLAEQPEAIVVDVAGVELREPAAAVGVLRQVSRATGDWPGARLTLCDERGEDAWRGSGWVFRPDSAAAFAELGAPRSGNRIRLDLKPEVSAARRCREAISQACVRWGRPALAEGARIVVTEMVNNVVAHAGTAMIVLIATRGDILSIAVRDQSVTGPAYGGGQVSSTADGGRGMLLIDSVAERWGSLALADGKVVWALLAQPRE